MFGRSATVTITAGAARSPPAAAPLAAAPPVGATATACVRKVLSRSPPESADALPPAPPPLLPPRLTVRVGGAVCACAVVRIPPSI